MLIVNWLGIQTVFCEDNLLKSLEFMKDIYLWKVCGEGAEVACKHKTNRANNAKFVSATRKVSLWKFAV